MFSQIYITGTPWESCTSVRNSDFLGCGSKSLKDTDAHAKINVFYQLALLSNNLVLMSY